MIQYRFIYNNFNILLTLASWIGVQPSGSRLVGRDDREVAGMTKGVARMTRYWIPVFTGMTGRVVSPLSHPGAQHDEDFPPSSPRSASASRRMAEGIQGRKGCPCRRARAPLWTRRMLDKPGSRLVGRDDKKGGRGSRPLRANQFVILR